MDIDWGSVVGSAFRGGLIGGAVAGVLVLAKSIFEVKTRTCPRCGAPTQPRAKTCSECGRPLSI